METKPKVDSGYLLKLNQIISLLEKSQEFDNEFYSVTKSDIKVDVFKNVFSPGYFDDSEYFANNIQKVEGLNILEIGTGTGLIALKLAMGRAKRVVATDINQDALKNAAHNINNYNMESVVELREGYIFQPVKNEKFDIIFWNIPFCYLDTDIKNEIGLHKKINQLEKSVFNPYYSYLYDYLNEGFDYLNTNGRLLLGFSPTIGREDILEDFVEDLDLNKIVIKEDNIVIEDHTESLQILEFQKKVKIINSYN
jgi:release factor glutamine methyltransferase